MPDEGPWTKYQGSSAVPHPTPEGEGGGPWTQYGGGGGAVPHPEAGDPAAPKPVAAKPSMPRTHADLQDIRRTRLVHGGILNPTPAFSPKHPISVDDMVRSADRSLTDIIGLPSAVYGDVAEKVTRHASPQARLPQSHLPRPIADLLTQTLLPGSVAGTGGILQNLYNVFAAQPAAKRAQAVGNVAQFAGPPGVGEVGEIANLRKLQQLSRETGLPVAELERLIKEGKPIPRPVQPPGPLERFGRTAGRGIRQARNPAERGELTAAQEARAKAEAEARVREIRGKVDPTGERLAKSPRERHGEMAGEALGVRGESQLATSARRSGRMGDVLKQRLVGRASDMPENVASEFAKATGLNPQEVEGNFEASITERRKALGPKYEAAYNAPVHDTKAMRDLYPTPTMQDALRRAVRLMRDKRLDPLKLGLKLRPLKGRGRLPVPHGEIPEDQFVEVHELNAQTADYVKRALRDIVQTNTKGGKMNEKAVAANDILREFRTEIYNVNPRLREAAASAGDVLQQEDAFHNATKLLNRSTTEHQFAKEIGEMTAAEKRATLSGMLRDVWHQAGQRTVTPDKFLDPLYRKKVAMLMESMGEGGGAKAEQLFADVQHQADLHRGGKKLIPGGGIQVQQPHTPEEENALHAIVSFAESPRRFAIRGVARGLQDAMEQAKVPMTEAMHDEITRLLMMSPSELHAHLAASGLKPQEVSKIERLFNAERARKWGFVGQGLADKGAIVRGGGQAPQQQKRHAHGG